ncbi:ABC transporter ATP-binding protein [Streptomyces sp. NBC_00893]|uniref:ABC transporter ATP-binding protein n=1 Tax=Streptomyces sp. NBC_00893 TaxID=2975862 RepID=UPI0022541C72|nr:ABC transporter ATP-binding protein [Streptomyces sp. NBC_00893]MCX4845486.1 ABC transporter ATP-binding protein/permease [Streptomyces sp. NBC_00893]
MSLGRKALENPFGAPPLLWFRVAKLLSRDPRRLVASLGVILTSVVLTMLSTVLLKEVVDVALPQREVGLLSFLCSVMIVANILTSVLTVVTARLNNQMGQKLVHMLRKEVYVAIQKMPLEYFTSKSTSEVQTRLASDIGGVSNVLTFAAQGVVGSVVSLATSAIIMAIMSWPIALVSLTLAVALNVLNNRYAKKRRNLAHSQQERVSEMMQSVGDHLSLSGVLLGRTMAREEWQLSSFESLSLKAADEAVKQRLAGRTAFAIISMMLSLLPVVVYWAAGTVLHDVSLGAVIVITALQARLSIPIQQLMQLSSEIQASGALFERIFETIDISSARGKDFVVARQPGDVAVSSICLDGVSFRYPEGSREVLRSISMTLPAGGRIFIVGTSGSGKTTLALVLAGLLIPDRGNVCVNLANGSVIDNAANAVTLVPQESVLFNNSIRENLEFGAPGCTSEDMDRALEVVGLSHVVEGLPEGLESLVGERGAQMSGGERQRLALARALLSDYPAMVVDEFSSGIDKETAELIFANLHDEAKGKMLIYVTHRLPVLCEGDLIVTIKDGEAVEVESVSLSNPVA